MTTETIRQDISKLKQALALMKDVQYRSETLEEAKEYIKGKIEMLKY